MSFNSVVYALIYFQVIPMQEQSSLINFQKIVTPPPQQTSTGQQYVNPQDFHMNQVNMQSSIKIESAMTDYQRSISENAYVTQMRNQEKEIQDNKNLMESGHALFGGGQSSFVYENGALQ